MLSTDELEHLKFFSTCRPGTAISDPDQIKNLTEFKKLGLAEAAIEKPSKGLLNYGEISLGIFKRLTPAGRAYLDR